MDNIKVIVAMLLIATLVAPFGLNMQPAAAGDADDSSWYNTVDGVLSTDDYYLYPYLAQDLKLGYSKFGEKIDAITWTGLQYNGLVTSSAATSGADPFANPGIDPNRYVEGWWLGITYQHRTAGWRTLWAWAEFADFTGWGSPTAGDYLTPTYSPGARVTSDGWIRMPYATDPQDAASGSPHGGRKTNARCVTEDIKVLYDGPRRYIALVSTTLYDQSVIVPSGADAGDPISESGSNVAVVRLNILIEFNKVKKEVIQKKDVKLLIDDKTMLGDYAYLEFSNRGEWDLGTTENYRSYAHFYTVGDVDEAPTTKYVIPDYHKPYSSSYGMQWPGLTGMEDKYAKAQIISDGAPYVGWAAYWPHPSYWTVYGWGYEWDPIGQDFSPNDVWDSEFGVTDDSDYDKPELREDDIADAGTAPRPATFRITATEPEIPFVIGEWNFIFSLSNLITQFRGVTVYGVTDLNDGLDNDKTGDNDNAIDSEVAYQNNEVFNPFDLNDAVHKQESRWVEYDTNTLTRGLDDQIYYAYRTEEVTDAGLTAPGWTGYFIRDSADADPRDSTWLNNFEDDPATYGTAHSKNWFLFLDPGTQNQEELLVTPIAGTPTATAPLTLQFKDLVDWGFWYRVPAGGVMGPHIEVKVYRTPNPATDDDDWAVIGMQMVVLGVSTSWTQVTLSNIEQVTSYAGQPDEPFLMWEEGAGLTGGSSGAPTLNEQHSWEYFTNPAILGDYYVQYVGVAQAWGTDYTAYVDDLHVTYTMGDSGVPYRRVYNMEEDKLVPSEWGAYCSSAERVIEGGVLQTRDTDYSINFETGVITPIDEAFVTADKTLYSTIEENEKGRYEWGIVGTNSAAVDSAGLGYVTEAFDSLKDIEVQKMGLDIQDPVSGTAVPYIFSGTGSYWSGYKDSIGRVSLQNDYCTSNAIKSSNIIVLGGPDGANLGSYYTNDFGPLFYGNEYAHSDYAGKIIKHECWDRFNTAHNDNELYGPGDAVIQVYKDIDGTIILSIWGKTGQETYYAAMWFWHQGIQTWWDQNNDGIVDSDEKTTTPGIVFLQDMNPGVTAIDLHFGDKYNDQDDTETTTTFEGFVTLTEALGTVSEKYPHQDP